MGDRPLLYLIDGHAVAYRHFHGLPATFKTQSGELTNAVYGFSRMLIDLLEKDPHYVAVTFDRGLSGREKLYPDYKAQRDAMPEDLAQQMKRIQEVVEAFNIPVLVLDGYEADDIIGTVTKQALEQNVSVHIITGDRDILQLLVDGVEIQLPSRKGDDVVYDVQAFIDRYTVRPDQWVDYKGLVGDPSDNIPGVKGIGDKTAVKLLTQYDTLEGVYSHLDEITGANHRKLQEGREMAFLSQELAAIKLDVPVKLDLQACVTRDYSPDAIETLFRELEFRSHLEQMRVLWSDDETPSSAPEIKTVVVQDQAGLDALVKALNRAGAIVWDVETTSVDQMQAVLVGIALAVDGETGYYVPVGHKPPGADTLFAEEAEPQLPLDVVLDALRGPLTDPKIPKYAHNATYDLVVMRRYGIDVNPVGFDTMVAEWLRNPISKYLGLKNFADQYLGVLMTPISELIGTGRKQITMDQVKVSDAAPYAAADAVMTWRAEELLRQALHEDALDDLYQTLELPLVPVIADMEQAGVALDTPFLRAMGADLGEQLAALEQRIYDLTDGYGPFNINSPKQLNEVLFEQLGLPTEGLKKTRTGQFSVDVNVLEQLRADTKHPIVAEILNYRELAKLKSTYVDALPELVNPVTGRLHTSYNQTGTATGRLSSSNPNLQNIPIRTELGRAVRKAFVAPEGRMLLAVDYSQIELRVLAHISQDATLIEAFAQGQDIHKATAAAVYGVTVDDVTYEQRSFAKRVNFGLIYGMGAFRLARDSDLTLAEARDFIDRYFERLPGVERYIDETKKMAAEQGYLTTLFGRKRYFPALKNGQGNRQSIQSEERAAINMPIQGTAADIMKRAMIDVHHALRQQNLGALMTLQVHDELVFEVPVEELDVTRNTVIEIMESALKMDVPLRANAEVGANWLDMQSVS